jgi:hypothetical protein
MNLDILTRLYCQKNCIMVGIPNNPGNLSQNFALHCSVTLSSALQLLPCGHFLCESCHARMHSSAQICCFCRKPFNKSEVFRCPVALQPRGEVRDDPKYAKVRKQNLPATRCRHIFLYAVWMYYLQGLMTCDGCIESWLVARTIGAYTDILKFLA